MTSIQVWLRHGCYMLDFEQHFMIKTLGSFAAGTAAASLVQWLSQLHLQTFRASVLIFVNSIHIATPNAFMAVFIFVLLHVCYCHCGSVFAVAHIRGWRSNSSFFHSFFSQSLSFVKGWFFLRLVSISYHHQVPIDDLYYLKSFAKFPAPHLNGRGSRIHAFPFFSLLLPSFPSQLPLPIILDSSTCTSRIIIFFLRTQWVARLWKCTALRTISSRSILFFLALLATCFL